jgi:hypothetical protein
MTSKLRRHLGGTFAARELGEGNWRLSREEPVPADVFLRLAHSATAEALRAGSVSDIDIEWRDEAVLLTVTSAERRRSIKARSAIVHEPLGRLYEALPLAEFDAGARRFWLRVFRLVRIPGGRHLLGLLARRSRGRR